MTFKNVYKKNNKIACKICHKICVSKKQKKYKKRKLIEKKIIIVIIKMSKTYYKLS